MSPEFQKTNCEKCEFAGKISGNGGFRFLGCRHKPYHGKWVAEIKECPIEKIIPKMDGDKE